jgi:hypothetical protein
MWQQPSRSFASMPGDYCPSPLDSQSRHKNRDILLFRTPKIYRLPFEPSGPSRIQKLRLIFKPPRLQFLDMEKYKVSDPMRWFTFVGSALFTAGGVWMIASGDSFGWLVAGFFGLCIFVAAIERRGEWCQEQFRRP